MKETKTLPLKTTIETPKILKQAIATNRALARLNGTAKMQELKEIKPWQR